MIKTVKIEVEAVCSDAFGNYTERKIVPIEEYEKAKTIEESARWGRTQYLTTVTEETVARLLGVSACNATCRVVRRHKIIARS